MIETLLLASASPAVAGQLAGFAPWLDRCWTATIAPETTDTHCFSRAIGEAHVRDRHWVKARGATVYEGETLYSAEDNTIVFVYLSSAGGIGRGRATPVPGGFDFALTMRGTPSGVPKTGTVRWRWAGPSRYSVRNGEAPEILFERDPDARPAADGR